MNILYLNLKAKWYEMIESGIKTEEYREIKPYWIKRLCVSYNEYTSSIEYKEYDAVKFIYVYTKRSMSFKIKEILVDTGKPEWGAGDGVKYFVIKLGERIE